MSAIGALRDVYIDPHPTARAAKASGTRICGYVGGDVPEELIRAGGKLPVRLRGDGEDTPLDPRFGYLAEPVTRSILRQLTNGTYDYLDALVIDRSRDAHAQLFFTLRQIRLMLPEVQLPELHFFDLLHLPHRTTERYNRDRVRELAAWLGADAAPIAKEVACADERRAAFAALAQNRVEQRISGADALALIGTAMLMPRADHAQLLRDAVQETAHAKPRDGRRVFVTGSGHDNARLYAALESTGHAIVGDDHDWGDRYYADPVDEHRHWLDAITDRAMYGAPAAAKYGLAERVRYICERVKATGAEMLISINRVADDAALWEFPDLRKTLAPLPCVCAAGIPYGPSDASSLLEQLP